MFKNLIKQHPFASGNRRTAFISTKAFLLENKQNFNIKSDPELNRSKDLNDEEALEVVSQEINHFNKLIRGHEKLLEAIGKL